MPVDNIQDLIDVITNGTRAKKEELTQLLRDNQTLQRETNNNNQKAASDVRRAASLTFIRNTVEPTLTRPSGNYRKQHGEIRANIETITSHVRSAPDGETREELQNRIDQEQDVLTQLRKEHATGIIT